MQERKRIIDLAKVSPDWDKNIEKMAEGFLPTYEQIFCSDDDLFGSLGIFEKKQKDDPTQNETSPHAHEGKIIKNSRENDQLGKYSNISLINTGGLDGNIEQLDAEKSRWTNKEEALSNDNSNKLLVTSSILGPEFTTSKFVPLAKNNLNRLEMNEAEGAEKHPSKDTAEVPLDFYQRTSFYFPRCDFPFQMESFFQKKRTLDEMFRIIQTKMTAGMDIWLMASRKESVVHLLNFFSELSPGLSLPPVIEREIIRQTNKNKQDSSGIHQFSEKDKKKPVAGSLTICIGRIQRGFQDKKIAIWCDHEVFGLASKKRQESVIPFFEKSYIDSQTNEESQSARIWIEQLMDLKEGGYVVHLNEGIGIFRGLVQLKTEEMKKDYLKLEYLDKAFLYVPIEQMMLVEKFVGGDGAKQLSKLGGSGWSNLKKRVKEKSQKLAKQLIELYGKRQVLQSTPMGADDYFQKDFEWRFPYEETEDQLKVIEEIKEDLMQNTLTDRLLVADVGFGKTEVALRAAFKVIINGFQVVFLAPTTILTEQHYINFVERFKDMPVNIGLLNRNVSKKKEIEIRGMVLSGEIDLLISTHKIFSKKIQFKKLGLFVIDEEQRFGVKQKENLKERYPEVNTLSLSATPIPRTLHMAMSGIRDISIINTPPQGRQQIRTSVLAYDEGIVQKAIFTELQRGGQVFYVYNFVKGIETEVEKIKKLIPNAKVGFAHGQAKSEKEKKAHFDTLEAFVAGEIDILVTTSIIENGIDIKNANTLILVGAERFGLAQLYQIRGRIGRSSRKAFAYFFYPAKLDLGTSAKKRLQSLSENTALGSGFHLSMRDLEIRGAGNLLGAEQSGSISLVGYDLYCKLLKESIANVSSKKEVPSWVCMVDVRYDGSIEDEYIEDNAEKIRLYRLIASVESEEDAEKLKNTIRDRYGSYPQVVEKLFAILAVRLKAKKALILSISEKMEVIYFDFFALAFDKGGRDANRVKKNIFDFLSGKVRNDEEADIFPKLSWSEESRRLLVRKKKNPKVAETVGQQKKIREKEFWEKMDNINIILDRLLC